MLISAPLLQLAAIVAQGPTAPPADPIAVTAPPAPQPPSAAEAAAPVEAVALASSDPAAADLASVMADVDRLVAADGASETDQAAPRPVARHDPVPEQPAVPEPVLAAAPSPAPVAPPDPAPSRPQPVLLAALTTRDPSWRENLLGQTPLAGDPPSGPEEAAPPVRLAQAAPAVAPVDLPPSTAATESPPLADPARSAPPATPEATTPAEVPAPAPAMTPAADAAPSVAVTAAPTEPGSAADADEALLPGRRRPGAEITLPARITQDNPGGLRAPPPEAFPTSDFPVPDRWRIVHTLCPQKAAYVNIAAACGSILDPYHQNFLKGDRPIDTANKPGWLKWLPITGDDWFLNVSATSDTIIEPRSFPTPVGVQTTQRPGSNDTFGRANSFVAAQTFIGSVSLIKGSTAYKPPEIEYRVTLAYQENYAKVNERRILFVEPSRKPHRLDGFVGVQEAFIDKHIRNVSDRYDFDSVRIGIQPFQADFRGFLFNDNQLGIRVFGNRDDNRFQYNLAGFWRLEKDTNSGLNIVTERPRDDVALFANVYRQDFPFPGITTQLSATINFNREKNNPRVDDNGFPTRPALLGTLRGRNYTVGYLGLATDGHIGRINLTTQAYLALGTDSNNFFNDEKSKIRAYFGAAEASYDVSWVRFRLSALYASGDKKAYDKTEGGFDAIFENPVFAGADTSYFIRQSIPFAGGGRAVGLKQRNGLLNDVRTSKEEGQSNFNNPGTVLLGVGADADFTPDFRLSGNVNHLWFANTAVLQALRVEGSIPRDIGWDISTAAIYRPHFNQNIVFRLSGAVLEPGKGFKDLFGNTDGDKRYYSVLFNTILTF